MTMKRILAVSDMSVEEAAVIHRDSEFAIANLFVHVDASSRLPKSAGQLRERLELRIRPPRSR
jgi:hypothetical protein